MTTTQALKNMAYGMQIRLAGMKRRGEDKDKIGELEKKHDALVARIEKERA